MLAARAWRSCCTATWPLGRRGETASSPLYTVLRRCQACSCTLLTTTASKTLPVIEPSGAGLGGSMAHHCDRRAV